MNSVTKTFFALLLGAGVYGFAQAAAEYRPSYCPAQHDHRSHDASYYDYYEKDDYYRAGPYRRTKSNDRYDYDRGYDSYRSRGRYRSHRPRSRVVNRETYSTRHRARIVLVEEIYWTRSGRRQLVCSILVRGPEAYYVPDRRLRRIANRDCSRRARIQYL